VELAESTVDETCRVAMQTLGRRRKEIPFALLYLVDAGGKQARLAGTAGIEPGQSASPSVIPLNPAEVSAGWPLGAAMRGFGMIEVADLASRFDEVPAGPWAEPPRTAVVVPLASSK